MRKLFLVFILFLSLSISFGFAQPVNNTCAGAIPVSVGSTVGSCSQAIHFDNSNATDSGTPTNLGLQEYYTGKDLWYSFVAPPSGMVEVHYASTNTNAAYILYEIYSGTCGGLVFEGFENLLVVPGNTYFVRFYQWGIADPSTLDFCINEIPPPPNYNCANATSLDFSSYNECLTPIEFEKEIYPRLDISGCSLPFYEYGAWYQFVAPLSGTIYVEGSNSISLFSGSCGSLSFVDCLAGNSAYSSLVAGATYYVVAHESNSCIFPIESQPSNDGCSGAKATPINSIIAFASEIHSNSFEANPSCGYVGSDAWYSFVAPSSGSIELLFNSAPNYSRGINYAIYSGTCGNLQELSCGNITQSANRHFSNGLISGNTYLIRLWNNYYSEGFCRIELLEGSSPPVNNQCSNPEVLTINPVDDCSTNFSADFSFPTSSSQTSLCSFEDQKDLWYTFVAPPGGIVKLKMTTRNKSERVGYEVYAGACASLTNIGCGTIRLNQDIVLNGMTNGNNYLLRLYYPGNENLITSFCISEANPANAVVNDDCLNASIIDAFPFTFNARLAGATFSGVAAPSCGGIGQSPDIWFSFVAPSNGKIQFSKADADKSAFAIYENGCGGLNEVWCTEMEKTTDKRQCNILTPGNTYHIRHWRGYGNSNPSIFYILPIDFDPVNSDCSAATVTNLGDGDCQEITLSFNGAGNSTEPDPSCGIYDGGDLWYKIVGPPSGNVLIETNPLNSELGVEIYSGPCNTLVSHSCLDVSNNKLGYISGLTSGVEYWVRLWDVNFDQFDNQTLCLKQGGPIPVNDDCANATPLALSSACQEVELDTYFATNGGLPIPECNAQTQKDIWYSFTAGTKKSIIVQSPEWQISDRLFMSLYTGSCGALTEVSCESIARQTFLDNLTSGTSYLLRIWDSKGEGTSDKLLCIKDGVDPPANDDCANAIVATVNTINSCNNTYIGTTLNASDSGLDNNCVDENYDVWYTFTVPATGTVSIKFISKTATTYYQIYTDVCGSLTPFARCQSNETDLKGLPVGESVFVRFSTNSNNDNFEFCISESYQGLVNESCSGALEIVPGVDVCGSTVTAELEGTYLNAETECFDSYFGVRSDLWYKFDAPASGSVRLELESRSTFNSEEGYVGLLSGACNGLTHLDCVQWGIGGSSEKEWNDLIPNQTYYLQVSSFESDLNEELDLCLAGYPIEAVNDLCSNPTVVSESLDNNCNNSITTTTYGGYDNYSDCVLGSKEVFYMFTPSSSHYFQVDISNFSQAVNLSVYKSSCQGELIACGQNSVVANLESGTDYIFAVAAVDPNQWTNFDLCVFPISAQNSLESVGIGIEQPLQSLHVDKGIAIGNTETPIPGSMRFTGSQFQGFDGSSWVSFSGSNGTPSPISPSNLPSGNSIVQLTNEIFNDGDNLGNHSATENLNLGSNRIIQMATPVNPTDGANKSYVDDAIAEAIDNANIDDEGIDDQNEDGDENDTTPGIVDEDTDPTNELITSFRLPNHSNKLYIADAGGERSVDLGKFTSYWALSGDDLIYEDGGVGILTDAPGAELSVIGEIRATQDYSENEFVNMFHDANYGVLGSKSSSGIALSGNYDPQGYWRHLVVKSSGKVGIGLNPDPTSTLDVDGMTTSEDLIIDGPSGTNAIEWDGGLAALRNDPDALTWDRPNFNMFIDADNSNTNAVGTHFFRIYTDVNSSAGNTPKVQFDLHSGNSFIAAGKFGIGTTSPSDVLHVNATSTNNAMRVQINGGTKMRIFNNGAIVFGNTTGVGADVVYVKNRLGLSVANPTYKLELPNSTVIGTGRARANAWITYSDQRVKKSVAPIRYGLEEVMQLRPVSYAHHSSDFVDGQLDVKDEKKEDIGFLAQEVYEVIEEIIEKPADETKSLWSMNYEKLTPVLVKAIQEQQQIILNQQSFIEKMSERLSEVEAKLDNSRNN